MIHLALLILAGYIILRAGLFALEVVVALLDDFI